MGFGRVEFYPDLIDKAAVVCARLARNHPLPDGNKRVAYLALLEFLARNEVDWAPPSVEETVARSKALLPAGSRSGSSPPGSAPRA
jgi:prophage maintenance system killer protein